MTVIAPLCLVVSIVGCGVENSAVDAVDREVVNDNRPPCDIAKWVRLNRVHQAAEIPITVRDGRSVELARGMGDVDRPSGRYGETASVWFKDSGEQTVFVRTKGDDCSPAVDRWVFEVLDAYPDVAGSPQSDAIPKEDPGLIGWAVDWERPVLYGPEVDDMWRTPERALGPATGGTTDIVSLGDGGRIDLRFDGAIYDGPGPDFVVFENSFSDTFLELAFVAVSSDGEHFAHFPTVYLGDEAVGGYGDHEPSLFDGFAGRYKAGFGTPFDLDTLRNDAAVLEGHVDLDSITTVRIIDVVGDGSELDVLGHPIFDPYPTRGSGGFDLEAVGVIHLRSE